MADAADAGRDDVVRAVELANAIRAEGTTDVVLLAWAARALPRK